jgi:DNA topoisomerase-1
VRYGAKEILGAVARQLGNTPAVCKKAYVHPAVLALGNQLSSDADAITAIWQRLAGTRATRRLPPAEARLLAFLRQQRRVQGTRDTRTVSRSITTR